MGQAARSAAGSKRGRLSLSRGQAQHPARFRWLCRKSKQRGSRWGRTTLCESTIAEEDQSIAIGIAKAELPRAPFGIVDADVPVQNAARGELLEQGVRVVDFDP